MTARHEGASEVQSARPAPRWRDPLVFAIFIVLSLAACGRVGFELNPGAADPDGGSVSADAPAMLEDAGLGPFANITPLDTLNTELNEDDPTLTADMLEIIFDRSGELYHAQRSQLNDAWSAPVALSTLNTIWGETTPELSADGLTLYFSSNRPGGLGEHDFYMSERADRSAGWSDPVLLTALSSSERDVAPTPSADLCAMVISTTRPGGAGGVDLWIATRASPSDPWGEPQNVVELNTSSDDTAGYFLDGTRTLYFASDRDGGERELWVAHRADDDAPFEPPSPVVELNTIVEDTDIWVAPDHRTAIFSRNPDGHDELFQATR